MSSWLSVVMLKAHDSLVSCLPSTAEVLVDLGAPSQPEEPANPEEHDSGDGAIPEPNIGQ